MKKTVIPAFILLLCSLMVFSTAVYAWITFTVPFSRSNFTTGELAPQTELYFWDTDSQSSDKWTQVPANQEGNIEFFPNFGAIQSIAELPPNMGLHLKIKVNDGSGANYKWGAAMSDIGIKAIDGGGDEITATAQNNIDKINYFAADGSQRCFYYATATGADALSPAALTYGPDTVLTTKGQLLNSGFLPQTTWLYVYIRPSLTELQNILRCIPIEKSPYKVQFTLTIIGEGRTAE